MKEGSEHIGTTQKCLTIVQDHKVTRSRVSEFYVAAPDKCANTFLSVRDSFESH